MTDLYFCIFCDTIPYSLDDLRVHLTQHFTIDETNECEILGLDPKESDFIEDFVEYENQLNECLQLNPKELPKDNVEIVLIGCPACDAIIQCYGLLPNDSQNSKNVCFCGQHSNDKPLFPCIQCLREIHFECLPNSDRCFDCLTKDFKISYLKYESLEVQREHCHKHLGYYPYKCQFKTDEGICGKKFISFNLSKNHLKNEHIFYLSDEKDSSDTLSQFFDLDVIPKIDELINTRLNAKYSSKLCANSIQSTGYTNNPVICNNSFMKNIGLCETIDNHFEDINRFDTNINSFRYSSHTLTNSDINDHYFEKGFKNNNRFLGNEVKSRVKRPKRVENRVQNDTLSTFATNSTDELDLNENEDYLDINIEHDFSYLNWFTQTKRTKVPYFPQKDDIVYYIPYGHELYREEVMRKGVYNLSNKHNAIRFYRFDKFAAKVAKIDFEFKECRKDNTVVRCVYITLRPLDEKYGKVMHVKYHDMEGVVDFMILKEHYESSILREWNIGEHFRSIVGDHYWFGEIMAINDAEYCRESQFKKYWIKWHFNGLTQWLSPWDLETFEDSPQPINLFETIPITDTDRQIFFESAPEEWPGFNEEKELRRVANGLKRILNMDKTKEFSLLDDLSASRYREKMLYPVDMKTFISRVENRYYRRHLAIKYDIKFMESNVRKLIKSVKRDPEYRFDDDIAKRLKYHTKFVTALCLLFIDRLKCKNPYELYNDIDDYLETHDVKCYSAKRVHLNAPKKNTNLFNRFANDYSFPQSFTTSKKKFKIMDALRNTQFLSNGRQQPIERKAQKKSFIARLKTKARRKSQKDSNPKSQSKICSKSTIKDKPIINEDFGDDFGETNTFNVCNNYYLNNSNELQLSAGTDYSSDVSRSDNGNFIQMDCTSDNSDDSDIDPDYKTTVYYKTRLCCK